LRAAGAQRKSSCTRSRRVTGTTSAWPKFCATSDTWEKSRTGSNGTSLLNGGVLVCDAVVNNHV